MPAPKKKIPSKKAKAKPKPTPKRKSRTAEEKQSIVNEICDRIATNNVSLRKATEGDVPISKSTFLDWCSENPSFADQYARAMEARTDAMADEILEIADDSKNDWQINPETGKEYVNMEVVARSRIRIDSRKWLMSKMAPKKYGDRLEVEQTVRQTGSISISFVKDDD